MFGSSEQVCDLTKSSISLNFQEVDGDMEEDGDDPGDGYADIRRDPDDEPLLDFSENKTTSSSKSSFFGKSSLNQLNGSIVSLSSQLSKQIRATEDDGSENGEEHIGLLENEGSQGSDDAFETAGSNNVQTGLTSSTEPPKKAHAKSSGALETSLHSAEVDPAVLVQYARPERPKPLRRPSQQTEV